MHFVALRDLITLSETELLHVESMLMCLPIENVENLRIKAHRGDQGYRSGTCR